MLNLKTQSRGIGRGRGKWRLALLSLSVVFVAAGWHSSALASDASGTTKAQAGHGRVILAEGDEVLSRRLLAEQRGSGEPLSRPQVPIDPSSPGGIIFWDELRPGQIQNLITTGQGAGRLD
jgi:hypothetical protein